MEIMGDKEKTEKTRGRLYKTDSDCFDALWMIIERYTENTEHLNMLLVAIPKIISKLAEVEEGNIFDLTPDILTCKTPDEVCDLILKKVKG